MIGYEDASKIVYALLVVIGGAMTYFGKKHEATAKVTDTQEEQSQEWIEAQFDKVEKERDAALVLVDSSRTELSEVKGKSFQYVVVLLDIIKRLCYMLAASDGSRSEINKHEIMTVIKYRDFDGKAALLQELSEIFGIQSSEIAIPKALKPAGRIGPQSSVTGPDLLTGPDLADENVQRVGLLDQEKD